jgi:hypothetical protein
MTPEANGFGQRGETSHRVWDSLFDTLSALLWRPTENRPAAALRIWVVVTVATFAGLTLYLVFK